MPLPRALAAPLRWMRRPRVWLALVAGSLGVYSAVGFWGVPRLLRSQLPTRLSALLGRPVRLDKVIFNPFTFHLELQGFAVMEPDGAFLVRFDRLLLQPRARTLFFREMVLERVALKGFHCRYQILPGGRTNVSDILARLAAPPATGKPSQATSAVPAKPTSPPRSVYVRSFNLEGARATFEDLSGPDPFRAAFGPYALDLEDFCTRPGTKSSHTFVLKGATGETLVWSGTFGLDPLSSEGHLYLEHLPLPHYARYWRPYVGFDVRKGLGMLQTDYRFAWNSQQRAFQLWKGSLRLTGLELAPKGGGPVEGRLGALGIEGITYDLFGDHLRAAELTLGQGSWTLNRGQDGALSLANLFMGPPVRPEPVVPPKPVVAAPSTPARPRKVKPSPAPPPPKPFQLRVDRVRLDEQRFAFEDRSTTPPVRTGLHLKRLETGPFTLDPKGSMPLRAEATLETGGSLTLKGQVQPMVPAFQADLALTDLHLPPFQAYGAVKAPIPSGRLSTRLHLKGDFAQRAQLSALGGMELANFAIKDPGDGSQLIDLPSLGISGLAFTLSPFTLRVARLDMDRPAALLRLEPHGSNLARALGASPQALPSEAQASAALQAPLQTPIPPPTPAPAPEAPVPVHLDHLVLRGGSFHFQDTTVQPSATVALETLELEGRGFSTLPGATAPLTLSTRLDGTAPFSVKGRFNLLDPFADSDLAVQTRGWDLAPSAPYIVKYLGYAFRKGKLDLDVAWKVRQRNLEAENRAKLDQFYLGEKVPGPDAIKAPVKLGLALLRDRRGVIEADIPVAGNLDAPDFKLRKTIWKAVGNLFTKLATSPFDALAQLVGAKEDLSQAPFLPGQPEADGEGAKRLEALAKALQARPELSVEVEGAVDPQTDGAALRNQAFDALLARTRGTAGPVAADERPTLIAAAWRAAHPVPKGEKPGPEPKPEAMEQQLRDALPAPDLGPLRERRAAAAQEALVRAGIDVARIFRVGDKQPAPYAGVRLKVK